jgi:hypothetical protein
MSEAHIFDVVEHQVKTATSTEAGMLGAHRQVCRARPGGVGGVRGARLFDKAFTAMRYGAWLAEQKTVRADVG